MYYPRENWTAQVLHDGTMDLWIQVHSNNNPLFFFPY